MNLFLPAGSTKSTGLRGPPSELSGWRKGLVRALRWLGPSWRAAPLRRATQSLSLGLFLVLFFYVAWPHADVFDTSVFSSKEFLPAELFLLLDPLVALSAAVAGRAASVALVWAAGVLAVSLVVPRGFCGYVCPLGTLCDISDWLFDHLLGGRVRALRLERLSACGAPAQAGRGWWVHLRYYVLAAVGVSAVAGVLLAGYVSAIPLLNRGLRLSLGLLQTGLLKGWDALGPPEWTSYVAGSLLAAALLAGLLRGRFWCCYVCPTGALFSLASVFRLTERKVDSSCIDCGKCVQACPFDAIKPDFTTRQLACTSCQTCGGTCPARAISFGWRRGREVSKAPEKRDADAPRLSRRGFIASAGGGVAAAVAIRSGLADGFRPLRPLLRPPGSVEEGRFLDLCVRCGECMKVCPGQVLHPSGLGGGLEALWTPVAVPSWAGCHQDCNFCTQVCPTRAIRPLSLEEKRKTKMGLAVIDTATCLPHAGTEECRICYETCEAAGYRAIRLEEVELDMGEVPEGVFSEVELEQMSRILAPFVEAEACVGCGQCENRCHTLNYRELGKLDASAVAVVPASLDFSPRQGRGEEST